MPEDTTSATGALETTAPAPGRSAARLACERAWRESGDDAVNRAELDGLIGLAEVKSADDGFSRSKYFKFLERYLYDFAEAAVKNPNLNKEFFCRENIGDIIQRHDAERLANEAKKTTTLMVSAAMIGGTILLIFILMVIPAIPSSVVKGAEGQRSWTEAPWARPR